MFCLVSGTLTTLVCLSVSQSCSELTQNKVHTDGEKTVTLMTSVWCFFTWRCFGQAQPLGFWGFWGGFSAI